MSNYKYYCFCSTKGKEFSCTVNKGKIHFLNRYVLICHYSGICTIYMLKNVNISNINTCIYLNTMVPWWVHQLTCFPSYELLFSWFFALWCKPKSGLWVSFRYADTSCCSGHPHLTCSLHLYDLYFTMYDQIELWAHLWNELTLKSRYHCIKNHVLFSFCYIYTLNGSFYLSYKTTLQ